MKYLTRWFAVILISVFMLAVAATPAEAGRPKFASLAPGEKGQFYVRFQWGTPAVASVVALGNADVELHMFDASGQSVVGRGTYGQRLARMPMLQSGMLRIEVHNLGPEISMVRLQTN